MIVIQGHLRGSDGPYCLSNLVPRSYDVLLDEVIIPSLVRSGDSPDASWTAELLVDLPVGEMPEPFTAPEHPFGSLEEAQAWLGVTQTRSSAQETL
jgi:hypothetical protein